MGKNSELNIGVINLDAIGNTVMGKRQRQAIDTILERDPSFKDVKVSYRQTYLYNDGGLIEKMPVPGIVKSSLRGREDYRQIAAKSDVVILNQQNIGAFCGLEMLRTPTILGSDATPIQLDSLTGYGKSPDNFPIAQAKHALNQLNFHLAAACFGYSPWVQESLINDYNVPASKVSVVSPGVDIDLWKMDRSSVPDKSGMDVLFVGTDFERKGGWELVQAFRETQSQNDRLHIVTKDPQPIDDPRITVYNNLTDANPKFVELYKNADVFAFPSHADTLGIVLTEALAAGLPVITTDVGAMPWVCGNEAGIVIEAGNQDQLSQALIAMRDQDMRIEMGKKGRQRAERLFDIYKNYTGLLNLARSVA